MTIAETIQHEVASWPGVTSATHGHGFVEFHVGRRELGHLHGSRLADLPFPVRIRQQLVAEGRGMLHHAHPESGWLSVPIRGEQDIPHLVRLFRFSYERPWLAKDAGDVATRDRIGPAAS